MSKDFGCVAVLLVLLLAFAKSTLAKEWFQGGALSDSVLSEWQESDAANKVSTSFGWISEQLGQDGYAKVFEKSEEIAKLTAEQVAECVDAMMPGVVAMGFALTRQKSQRVALVCTESFEGDSWKGLC